VVLLAHLWYNEGKITPGRSAVNTSAGLTVTDDCASARLVAFYHILDLPPIGTAPVGFVFGM
jgi:hypothetical protein